MAEQVTPWQSVAEDVLAAVAVDQKAFERVAYEYGVLRNHFPPGPWRKTYHAVSGLWQSDDVVTITAIHDWLNGDVSLEWLSGHVYAQDGVALGGDVLRTHAIRLKRRAAQEHQLIALRNGAQALERAQTDDERDEVVGRVISALDAEVNDTVQDATAEAVGARFAALMESEPEHILPTGITWLDNNTGGMQRRQIWWIAAAYKMRKSTLMRNMVIGALRNGAQVTVGIREGYQAQFAAQVIVMLAVEWLLREGLYSQRDKHGRPLNLITAAQLLTLHNRYKSVLDKRQVAAITHGIREFRSWDRNLRIYDSQEANGGLSDLHSIQTMVNRDVTLYGTDVVFLDYLQLFDAGRSSIFENVSYLSQQLQQLAAKKNVAMVVLAQLNEESVKGHNSSHSPGVKGGGDPAATADFLFQTGYPLDEVGNHDTTQLRIAIKLARHGESGKSENFPLHEASGLILPHDSTPAPDFGGGFGA